MSKPAYHMPARLPSELHDRFRLTRAMLDLWAYPSSETFLRFAHSEILFAGKHVGDSGEHEIARPAAFVDVLGLTTEYDYFLSFPCSENIQ